MTRSSLATSFLNMARFVVIAPGYAPSVNQIGLTKEGTAVTIFLDPSKPLRGQVVNSKGEPVPGATLAIGSYRDSDVIPWRQTADENGRFVWQDGPAAGNVRFEAFAEGYMRLIILRCGSRRPECQDRCSISPLACTARSPTPRQAIAIERFTITPGGGPFGSMYKWMDFKQKEGTNGRFDEPGLFDIDSGGPMALKFEAGGYEPTIVDGFTSADEELRRDVKLFPRDQLGP